MRKRVLMVVKTYPTPSKKYGETVCTAGIDLDTGLWIRIYPFPFRTVEQYAQFAKYETYELNVEKADQRDKRPESYRLIETATVTKIRDKLPTSKNNWAERLSHLLPTLLPSVNALKSQLHNPETDEFGRSLGMVKIQPGSVSVEFTREEAEWDDEASAKLAKARENFEQNLFTTPEQDKEFKTLRKVPFKVHVNFKDLKNETYRIVVTDWEIGILLLKQIEHVGEAQALKDVKFKIENQICSIANDSYFLLGSVYGHLKSKAPLEIIGFVYPKKPIPPKPDMDSLF